MADTGVDIDLYADMESEFPSENFDNDNIKTEGNNESNDGANNISGPDLYDDVLTNIKEEKPTVSSGSTLEKSASSSSLGSSSAPARRYQVYVGNLTWWTTDADIADAVLSVGVNDFLEVKFYENRANGQSKGFCCVSLASETSMRTLIDQLPKKELHGQAPVVTYATKQALNQFEAQSKTRPTPPPGGQSMGHRGPPPGNYRGSRPPTGSTPYGRPPLLGSDPLRGPPPGVPPPGGLMRLPPPVSVGAPPPHILAGINPKQSQIKIRSFCNHDWITGFKIEDLQIILQLIV